MFIKSVNKLYINGRLCQGVRSSSMPSQGKRGSAQAANESSSTALFGTLWARARNCGPIRMTAGPENWLAKRGSEARVVKTRRDSASEALSTIATGVVGRLARGDERGGDLGRLAGAHVDRPGVGRGDAPHPVARRLAFSHARRGKGDAARHAALRERGAQLCGSRERRGDARHDLVAHCRPLRARRSLPARGRTASDRRP